MKIGFIGLGRMGRPLASHLARKTEDLAVYDLQADAIAKLVELGARAAANAAQAAREADVVFTMLPGPAQVRSVVLGEGGVLSVMKPGSILVDLSTVDTDTVDAVLAEARTRGVAFADAPVGRLAAHADRGESLFMLGAEEAQLPILQEVLMRMGTSVLHCGAPGAGTRMKLINNLMVLCYCQLNSEALVLARSLGLDIGKTFEVLSTTTAANGQLKEKWPVKVLKGDLTPGFDIALGFKDLTLACQAAQSAGTSLPVGNLVRSLFQLARHAGRDGQDTSCMTDFWAQANGVDEIRL